MFGLKSKKKQLFEVVSPISGECIPIDEVNDEVFSKKMVGDGFAVKPDDSSNIVVSPVSGKIVALPDSKHAIGIQSDINDINILVHIGLNTVNLHGKGFSSKVKLNQSVKIGQPIMEINRKILKQANVDMTTMVVFTDGYNGSIELGSKKNHSIKSGQPVLKQA
ncbi:PTS sugar transporter subunit IIA [Companilactobacillus halodurans]|uniref:PTS glucose transporter subunit IIA n=1 Tax=Companilactobacillus halodurans TaxID=2584183 RepID=A0A5P0ZXB7_9LACO|nr:PTS glucose transporter subunit IIA [Companilactobacillus halodurans]MQS75500.1 PTS glucose transporter subunit IIA [Companilactobacillus halodurans]MQS97452.1 PTS glucose transporter subunit IIA [Companilactobacillus halodurans]